MSSGMQGRGEHRARFLELLQGALDVVPIEAPYHNIHDMQVSRTMRDHRRMLQGLMHVRQSAWRWARSHGQLAGLQTLPRRCVTP